jgi:hypothetical protein
MATATVLASADGWEVKDDSGAFGCNKEDNGSGDCFISVDLGGTTLVTAATGVVTGGLVLAETSGSNNGGAASFDFKFTPILVTIGGVLMGFYAL